jgi:hypothetical protein
MEGWRDEGMKGWRDEGMKGWRDEGMKGWRDEGMEESHPTCLVAVEFQQSEVF